MAWLDKLHRETEGDPPPPGAVTAEVYAARHGITFDVAYMRLKREAVQGKLCAGSFRTRSVDGKLRKVRHFWPAS